MTSGTPYLPEAFDFVRDGITHTVSMLDRSTKAGEDRHVSGQELCIGLCHLARDRFGPFAKAVLGSWNIHRTEDFGRIVFLLVAEGKLSATERDSLDDFKGVLDFDEALGRPEVFSGLMRRN